MKQDLVLDKTFIEYLANNKPSFRTNKANECVSIIEQNQIICDKNLNIFKKYLEKLESIQGEDIKQLISTLLEYWMQNCIKKLNFETNIDNFIELSNQTTDKILFNPDLTPKQINKLKIKYPDVEIHNDLTLAYPEAYHRLKNLNCKIRLEKGVYYDIKLFFQPFLREEKDISIIDPFLPNENAMFNFQLIFEDLKNKNIQIITHSKNNYVNKYGSKDTQTYTYNWDRFENFTKDLEKNDNNIQLIHFTKTKHQERSIQTETARISLPGGFDFINKEGFANIENEEQEIFEIIYSSI